MEVALIKRSESVREMAREFAAAQGVGSAGLRKGTRADDGHVCMTCDHIMV